MAGHQVEVELPDQLQWADCAEAVQARRTGPASEAMYLTYRGSSESTEL